MKASTIEAIFSIITLISYLLILATPFFVGKKTKNYLILLLTSIALTFVFSTISVYWSEELSNQFIYKLYGFDPYGMGESERWTKEITEDNRNTIEKIYNRGFGIGWPLKLLMSYVVFMIPYNLLATGLIYGWKKRKNI